MILCFYGDGKGKTTAAIGIAVRARGRGKTVEFIKLMKGIESGEDAILKSLGITLSLHGTERFVNPSKPGKDDMERARRGMELARESNADLVIVDEALTAMSFGLLGEREVVEVAKPFAGREDRHIVLTGREMGERIVEVADLISEVRKVKHYFDEAVFSLEGLEL